MNELHDSGKGQRVQWPLPAGADTHDGVAIGPEKQVSSGHFARCSMPHLSTKGVESSGHLPCSDDLGRLPRERMPTRAAGISPCSEDIAPSHVDGSHHAEHESGPNEQQSTSAIS